MNEVSRATLVTRRCVSRPFTAKQNSTLKNVEETQNVGQGVGLEGWIYRAYTLALARELPRY